jgi:hypothetical protein
MNKFTMESPGPAQYENTDLRTFGKNGKAAIFTGKE